MKIIMDRELAHAVGTDAGNRSMKRAGRTAWSEEDKRAAIDEFYRVMPEIKDDPKI